MRCFCSGEQEFSTGADSGKTKRALQGPSAAHPPKITHPASQNCHQKARLHLLECSAMQLVNPTLDFDAIRATLATQGFVAIPDFLGAETAELLADTLKNTEAWEFWSRGEDGTVVFPPERWQALSETDRARHIPTTEPANNAFHYAYERATPDPASSNPTLRTLGAFMQAMNSPGYLDLMRQVIRNPKVSKVDGAFSRYRRGHFLSPHTDANRDQVRLVAHVLGLTRGWAPDWGGELTLCHADGTPECVLSPAFNTMVLFTVPRLHHVRPVKVDTPRYSFFSWLVERDIAPHSTDETRRVV